MTEAHRRGHMALSELMARYQPAGSGDSWETAWEPAFPPTEELIARLQAELEAKGAFDEPVTLIEESWDDEGDEEPGERYHYPASLDQETAA